MIYNNYREWFLNYVQKFGNVPEIIIKKDHSLRVANNMKLVFTNLGMENDYIVLADFIGLFHDIGRFEQWRIYNTYNDKKSIDHADFSVNNIVNNNIISNMTTSKEYDRIIYDAIKYHNKLELPDYLNFKDELIFEQKINLKSCNKELYNKISSLYAMAIRDIDKLDILYQYLISNYLITSVSLPVSKMVALDFFNNKPINKGNISTPTDVLVLRLSFINDINLTRVLKKIEDGDFIGKIENVYSDRDNIKVYFDYAKFRLNELIFQNKGHEFVLKK